MIKKILMKHKIKSIIVGLLLATFLFGKIIQKPKQDGENKNTIQWIQPKLKNIGKSISTTGTVKPRNRISIQSPVSGRIEEILFQEGDQVKKGDIVAYVSSADRTAIIDAARLQEPQNLDFWKSVYKATAVTSPLSGTLISRPTEPGQSISSTGTLLVVSNFLIVEADVDETDIGQVKLNQKTRITLQSYPDQSVSGKVIQIAYESKNQNNVTIYPLKIQLDETPDFFRAGMSADVDIQVTQDKTLLTLPITASRMIGEQSMVYIEDPKNPKNYIMQAIETGPNDGEDISILSGIDENSRVIENPSVLNKSKIKKEKRNPFMFQRNRNNNKKSAKNKK